MTPAPAEAMEPCPFCGGTASPIGTPDGYIKIGCLECDVATAPYESQADAASIWNRRAVAQLPEGVVARHWDALTTYGVTQQEAREMGGEVTVHRLMFREHNRLVDYVLGAKGEDGNAG